MTIRAVIFDMDGVLVDSYRPHFLSWQRTAEARGLDMTEAMFAGTFGMTNEMIIPELYGDRFSDAEIKAWGEEKERGYREILAEDFPAMDGASELLQDLAEHGFALAVGSSGPPENIQVVLSQLPGAEHFSAVVSGRDVARGKPDPEVFTKAAGKLGLAPASCVVIEDSVAGLTAAKRAGMRAVALTGTTDRANLEQHADQVVESLRELSAERIGNLLPAQS